MAGFQSNLSKKFLLPHWGCRCTVVVVSAVVVVVFGCTGGSISNSGCSNGSISSMSSGIGACWSCWYLAVSVDGRAQQFPGSSSSVHAQHPEDLQEPQAAQGRSQHIALVTHRHHRHRGDQHEDVCQNGEDATPNTSDSQATSYLFHESDPSQDASLWVRWLRN